MTRRLSALALAVLLVLAIHAAAAPADGPFDARIESVRTAAAACDAAGSAHASAFGTAAGASGIALIAGLVVQTRARRKVEVAMRQSKQALERTQALAAAILSSHQRS